MLNQFLFLNLFLFTSMTAMAADYTTPTGRVKDSVDKVITILKNQSMEQEAKWKEIAVVIDEGFDFRSMSQSVLSTNWKTATPEERDRFKEFFSQYIAEIYRTRIESYTDEKVVIHGETIRGDRALVETSIITSTTEIPVHFRLKNNNGNWFAYDVIIEGVSLVANYRDTFSAIVKNEGMDGLISDLQRRIAKHKSRQAAQAEDDSSL